MELEGSLSVFSLPEVLQFLSQGRMSGSLTVARDSTEIRLEINEGKITNSSTIDRPKKLGETLVHRGVIPRSDLDQALASQREDEPNRLLGELLVERGHVSAEQLRSAIQLQMEEEIWELFSWREGAFRFDHGKVSDDKPAAVEIDIEPLLLEGSRRLDEWKHITKNIPEDQAIFEIVTPSREQGPPARLNEQEWMVLALINGVYSVESIIARTGYGTFETYSILNRLLTQGYIRQRDLGLTAFGPQPHVASASQASQNGDNGKEDSKSRSRSGGLLGGLLGKRRNGSEPETPAPQIDTLAPAPRSEDCATAVGVICDYINDLMGQLRFNDAFWMGANDANLLPSLWREIVNICPKADLIQVDDQGNLNASRFERFASQFKHEDPVQGCFEDSIEALKRLIQRLYRLSVQRVGDREAGKIFQTAQRGHTGERRMVWGRSFDLEPFVERAMI